MHPKKFNVSVIIPTFNGAELIRKNLPKVIEAKNNSANSISEIIIVDDGSADNSARLVKEHFPEVKFIKHKINRGFSATVNTGVRSSSGNLILLLNNDVIPEKDFLASILKHFENPKVFAVSLHEKNFGWAKGNFKDGYVQIGMGEATNEIHTSFYVSGGSGVFRRKIWVDLGGMDEKLLSPFYWEDIDLCYRAAKRGYVNLWDPNSRVVHNHESTVGKLPKSYVERIRERNQLLFIWKNIHSATLYRKHMVGMISRILKHPGYVRIVLMAMGRFGIAMKARRKEKKESKISDEAIFSRFA